MSKLHIKKTQLQQRCCKTMKKNNRGQNQGSKPGQNRFKSRQGENKYGKSRRDQGKPSRFKSDRDKDSAYNKQDKLKNDDFSPLKKYRKEDASSFERKKEEDPSEFKKVYRGRNKDQRPMFETVKKENFEREHRSSKPFKSNRFFKNKPEEQEEKPQYNFKSFQKSTTKHEDTDEIRLNKYIANSGICSRREADKLIEKGLVQVNGEVVTELGHKVLRRDKVTYKGKLINPEKPVYVLLNKPKDFITTTDDPMNRKTVMNLVSAACEERIFPVGRLDRNTTGLLLFTNDGDLASKLSHPSGKIKKIYQVTLDKPILKNDFEAIVAGLTLEDGLVEVDDIQILSKDRTILGMEIHVGKNRIVRRIFAHLGYDVVALDRVTYAGLTKKDLSRGKWRFLSEKEVIKLKFF